MSSVLMPYNWRKVKCKTCPPFDEINTLGYHRKPTRNEVLLYLDPNKDITLLRDWLSDNGGKYKMFGLFNVQWESIKYLGVIFSFVEINTAIHFKLAWN